MNESVKAAIAPMLRAGGVGFAASEFVVTESLPWKTMGRAGRQDVKREHEFVYYSVDEYFSVNSDKQAELAVEFLNQHRRPLDEIIRRGLPVIITLHASIAYRRDISAIPIQIPLLLGKATAESGIAVNTMVFIDHCTF